MGHRTALQLVLTGLLVCLHFSVARAADLAMEVISLKYRPAEQVLPVIQPLVPQPGTVTGLGSTLVVRTTPANLRDIKRTLAALDRAPRRLLITVRQDADRAETRTTAGASGAFQTSRPGTSAGQGADRPSGNLSARAYSTQSARNDRHTQQVQVTEGNVATINVGYSVPVVVRGAVRDSHGGRMVERWVETVEYRDILSGFSVRPQLAGDTVTLQVDPQHDTPGRYGRGSSEVQRVATTVSGRLGEWIDLGGIVRGQAFESDAATYRTNAASGDNRRILVRVEALD